MTDKLRELADRREFLLLASYCDKGGECSEIRPCDDCLAMCNVFDEAGNFLRELGPLRARASEAE